MDSKEYKRRLDELQNIIGIGLGYFHAWKNLFPEDNLTAQALNRYNSFFVPTLAALLNSTLIQFAKIYDHHPKAISLVNLLNVGKSNTNLIPNITKSEIEKAETMIEENKNSLSRLKANRDMRLAHHDAIVKTNTYLLFGEMKKLADDTVFIYNILTKGHNKSVTSYKRVIADAERNTRQVVQLIKDDLATSLNRIDKLRNSGL
jgi:hypothetical protein